MNRHARTALLGIGLALVLLGLAAFATDLRAAGGGVSRWAVAVTLAVGVVAFVGASRARRDALVPAIAAALLAWPVLAGLGILPAVPDWVPWLSAVDTGLAALLVGVLGAGAATSGRGR